MTTKKYRNTGAIGALLDEYEKALVELQSTVANISNTQLTIIVDSETKNSDCKSIQSILSHTIRAGNWYNIEIKNALGEELENPELVIYDTLAKYQEGLTEMFKSTERTFEEYPKADLYLERTFRWKHIYNIDILLEHAIVHILRHRRQIERFILEIKEVQ